MQRFVSICLIIALVPVSSSALPAGMGNNKEICIENTLDGGSLIAGSCGSILTCEEWKDNDPTKNIMSYTVARYTPQGVLLWRVNYFDPRNIVDCEAAIEIDEFNDFILTLTSDISGKVVAVVKYNQYGEMLWVRRINSAALHNIAESRESLSFLDNHTEPLRLPYQNGWPLVVQMSPFTISQSITGANFEPEDDENELTLCMMWNVHAWNHDAAYVPDWPVDPSVNYRGASIILQDGIGKLAFASWGTPEMVHVYSNYGIQDPGWPQIPGGYVGDSPVRADMDEDDIPEIVTGTGSPYYAYNWNPDASLVPNWPVNLTQNVTGQAVGDVNNDGELEFVCTSTTLWNKRVWVISADGQILHEWQPIAINGTGSSNSPVLADLDSDGDLEIILGGYAEIWCWHHDGTLYWAEVLPRGGDVSQIAVGDLDGDGDLEVVVCNTTRVFLLNHDGTLHEGDWPVAIPSGSWVWSSPEHSGPVIADIDGDGMQEIVLNGYCNYHGNYHWFLIAFNPDGSIVRGFPCIEPADYAPACSPTILDIDGDGDIEICSYAEDHPSPAFGYLRVVVYDLPTPFDPALLDWPMIQHDPQRTGCYGGVVNYEPEINDFSPAQAYEATPSEFALRTSYPNPFNPETVLSFELRAASFVELAVYDIQGREVARLVDGFHSAGMYQRTFDGAGLASGVYFACLQAEGFSQTRKLLLIK